MSIDTDTLSNPLAACPAFPACVRRSVAFSIPADSLLNSARSALESMNPLQVKDLGQGRVTSVHRAGFFEDDMEFVVAPTPHGSVLHVRSASRTGHWDLGVNRFRVWRFLRAVRNTIEAR